MPVVPFPPCSSTLAGTAVAIFDCRERMTYPSFNYWHQYEPFPWRGTIRINDTKELAIYLVDQLVTVLYKRMREWMH